MRWRLEYWLSNASTRVCIWRICNLNFSSFSSGHWILGLWPATGESSNYNKKNILSHYLDYFVARWLWSSLRSWPTGLEAGDILRALDSKGGRVTELLILGRDISSGHILLSVDKTGALTLGSSSSAVISSLLASACWLWRLETSSTV